MYLLVIICKKKCLLIGKENGMYTLIREYDKFVSQNIDKGRFDLFSSPRAIQDGIVKL